MVRFRVEMADAARRQIREVVSDPSWAERAARLAPVVATEGIIAWLDAGQPGPDEAAERVRHAIDGVINAGASPAWPGPLV